MPINMSYCRFRNTLEALQECADALDEIDCDINKLSSDERRAAKQLARLCWAVAEDIESQ